VRVRVTRHARRRVRERYAADLPNLGNATVDDLVTKDVTDGINDGRAALNAYWLVNAHYKRGERPRGEYRRFVWTPDQRRAYLVALDPDGTYVVATALPTTTATEAIQPESLQDSEVVDDLQEANG
jgi:hypothetical protein